MRILIYGLHFYPEPTGIGKYTGEMAAYLASQGHEVRVITTPPFYPHWKVQPGYSGRSYRRETWRGVDVLRCPVWVPDNLNGLTRLVHFLSFVFSSLPVLFAQLAWKPDTVLSIAPSLLNAPFALAFARLIGAKAWLHIQDFELEVALKLGLLPMGRYLSGLAMQFERLLLRNFDRVSSISGRMLSHLQRKGVPDHKIVMFPNWVDTTRIYPMTDECNPVREELGLTPEQTAVLYSGSMGRKQGLEYLVDAARHMQDQPHIQFVLCGDGPVRSKLEAEAEGLPNVRFLPVQPFERLNALLNAADIHVLPQLADAADLVMPSKLTGMLSSGKAVIATALQGTELNLVVSQIGIVVPPQDSRTLSETIKTLAGDTAWRKQLGRLGRQYATQRLEQKVILAGFMNELHILASGKIQAQYDITPSTQS
ncbi:MAG: glycosyltransferase WbuB [Chloroflexota bacterium]